MLNVYAIVDALSIRSGTTSPLAMEVAYSGTAVDGSADRVAITEILPHVPLSEHTGQWTQTVVDAITFDAAANHDWNVVRVFFQDLSSFKP